MNILTCIQYIVYVCIFLFIVLAIRYHNRRKKLKNKLIKKLNKLLLIKKKLHIYKKHISLRNRLSKRTTPNNIHIHKRRLIKSSSTQTT